MKALPRKRLRVLLFCFPVLYPLRRHQEPVDAVRWERRDRPSVGGEG